MGSQRKENIQRIHNEISTFIFNGTEGGCLKPIRWFERIKPIKSHGNELKRLLTVKYYLELKSENGSEILLKLGCERIDLKGLHLEIPKKLSRLCQNMVPNRGNSWINVLHQMDYSEVLREKMVTASKPSTWRKPQHSLSRD
ncbi:hypothetical protein Tco_1111254 [Tanacetum coccineum]|uniref:Uncharacterized protein n=1 Tax=Tanacetum coccineum TaxID=301880 RepID=A0ABQ5ILJ9_9ASTR